MSDSFEECPKISDSKLLPHKNLAEDLKKNVLSYLLKHKPGNLFEVFDDPNFQESCTILHPGYTKEMMFAELLMDPPTELRLLLNSYLGEQGANTLNTHLMSFRGMAPVLCSHLSITLSEHPKSIDDIPERLLAFSDFCVLKFFRNDWYTEGWEFDANGNVRNWINRGTVAYGIKTGTFFNKQYHMAAYDAWS